MLHLKSHKHTFSHNTASQRLQLSPVPVDNDELIQAIEDPIRDVWQLEATPDTSQLNEFWSGVEEDLKHDPSWFSFAEDEE